MAEFQWPWQYEFPPFFTLQPNLETRKKQLAAWCDLVLAYYKHHKRFNLDIREAQSSPLFNNAKINRKLSTDAIYTILEELRVKENLEWTDKTRAQCLVMWRTPEEWGNLIYRWASNSAMTNTVCTLYELTQGDNTKQEEFFGLDDWLLKRALRTLEKQRRAEIMSIGTSEGVKFF